MTTLPQSDQRQRIADGVIGHLALSEAELVERNHVLELENAELRSNQQSYRELAQAAMHALADLTRQRKREREQHDQLLEEYRTLRSTIMQVDARKFEFATGSHLLGQVIPGNEQQVHA